MTSSNREVKERAARSGRTVSAVLEDAVRRGLHPAEQRAAGRYVVRPTGTGGLRPGVDLMSDASLGDVMDEAAAVDPLR